jgi:hypothetical protein
MLDRDVDVEAARLLDGDRAAYGKTCTHQNPEVSAAHQAAELDRDARVRPEFV